jgi:hypothetical protein
VARELRKHVVILEKREIAEAIMSAMGGHYSARHFQLLPGILAMVVAAVCSAQEAVQPRVVKKLKRPRTRSVIHRPSDVG